MAFINTLFPTSSLRLIHGFQKSIASPVAIVGNSTTEYRIKKLANYRTSWRYPSRLLSVSDRRILTNFFTDVADSGLNSFKFLDPDAQPWANTALTYAGSGNLFYLTSRGSDTHPIYHLGPDVVVKIGTTPTAYTRVITNGVPMISVAGATSNVNISGSFYYAARFNQSELAWAMEGLSSTNTASIDSLSDISLIEVFEY